MVLLHDLPQRNLGWGNGASFSTISSWVSCVLQHFRPTNEENVMNTWRNLMTFKQSQNNEHKMLKKKIKTQKNDFLDFGSPGFSWLRFFVFFKSFLFHVSSFLFHFFLSFLIIFFDFFTDFLVLQHFRQKNEKHVMNTWQHLMITSFSFQGDSEVNEPLAFWGVITHISISLYIFINLDGSTLKSPGSSVVPTPSAQKFFE